MNSVSFQIFFSYGTYVEISLIGINTMNVEIVPSSHDEGVTVGLCGDLDNNWRNDFRYRPGQVGPILNRGKKKSGFADQPLDFIYVWK